MDKKKAEQLLLKRQAEIKMELESFSSKNPTMAGDYETRFERIGDSLEDAAMETENYIDKLPAEHRLESRLKEINDALARLKTGKYGFCERCGKKIPARRLEVLPEARFCTDES